MGGRPLLNGIECLTWSSVDDATMGGAVTAGTTPIPVGLVGAGQQDGADRLGGDGATRGLQKATGGCRLNTVDVATSAATAIAR